MRRIRIDFPLDNKQRVSIHITLRVFSSENLIILDSEKHSEISIEIMAG
jgi:hypothetical protein